MLMLAFKGYSQECTSNTEINESFDAVTQPNLPACWSKILRGSTLASTASVKTVRTTFNSSVNAVELANVNSNANSNHASPDDIMLVSPSISNLASKTHRLRFTARSTGTSQIVTLKGLLQIVTLASNNPTASFRLHQDLEIEREAQEYVVYFNNYSGTDTHIGFRFNTIEANRTILIDDVSWEATPNCPDVSSFTISAIKDQNATITWERAGQESGWEYVYGPSTATNPNTITPVNSVTATTATISGLTASTSYKVWIRSVCGTDKGTWSVPYVFVTACTPVATFNQTFDSGVTRPNLPACWSKIMRGPGDFDASTISTVNYKNNSPQNSVEFNTGRIAADTGNEFILVSPYVSTLENGGYRLKFYATADMPETRFEIGTMNGNGQNSVFTIVESVPVSSNGQFAQYVVDFNTPTTDSYIGIRLIANNSFTYGFIDNVVWEPMPLCPDVKGITLHEVQPTEAVVYWTPGGSEAGWEVAYGATSVTNPNTLSTIIPTNVPTLTIGSLTPNTSYKVWVRATCAVENGAWMGPITIRTACSPTDVLNENFETTTGTNLPGCWTKIIRGATVDYEFATITSTTDSPISGRRSVEFRIGNSNTFSDRGATADDIILVSPNLSNIGSGLYRLRFKAKYGTRIQVGTLDGITNSATFTNVQDIEVPIGGDEYTVNFVNATTDTYIGIRANSEEQFNNFYIDDIVWELIPPCPDVKAVNVPTVTPNSATVLWTRGTSEAAWDVAYGLTSVTDPNAATILPVTQDMASLTDLAPSTTYKVWVRSSCDAGKGNWFGPVQFSTPCLPIDNFDQNFDGVTAPAMPACWSVIVRGPEVTSGAYVRTASLPAHAQSGNNVVTYNTNYAFPQFNDDFILVSPNLSNVGAGTHRLKFYAKGITGKLEVGTLSGNTNASVFTPLKTINTTNEMVEYVINFDDFAGTTDTFIGFKLRSENFNPTMYIDNVVWEIMPACPDVTNVIVPNITPETAKITWTRGKNEAGWEVVYGAESVTDPNTLTPIEATTTSFDIQGLSPETVYNVWVRAICTTENGAWIGPIQFKTACLPVTEFIENFDAVSTPGFSDCWSVIARGITLDPYAYVQTTDYNSASAPNNVEFSNGQSNTLTNDDLILVTPNLSNIAAGTHRLKFKAKTNLWNVGVGNLQIVTLNGNTTAATSTFYKTVNLSGEEKEYSVYFNNYTGTDTYIGLRLYAGENYISVYVDDVIWEEVPEGECLAVKDVAFNAITVNSAVINWTAGGAESEWEVAYTDDSDVTDPSTLTTTKVNAETTTLSGLEENTVYKVWIKSICNLGNTVWAGPFTFTTKCFATNVPYILDFESAEIPNLPSCTESIIASGEGNNWEAGAISESGFNSNGLVYKGNQFQGADAWFFTQGINLRAGREYIISYKYGARTEFGESFNIMYGTDATAVAMVLPISEHYVTDPVRETHAVIFRAQTTGVYYFGFNVKSYGTGHLFIDDIEINQAAEWCPDVTDITVDGITNNEANVTWNAAAEETAWEVVYATDAATDPDGIEDVISVSDTANTKIENLEGASEYFVWVRSVCSDSDKGDWMGPIAFQTLCNVFEVPYIQDFESVAVPALPICSSVIAETDNSWVVSNNPGNGFESNTLEYVHNDISNGWFFTAGINLKANTSYTISYKYGKAGQSAARNLKVAYGLETTEAGMTLPIADHINIAPGLQSNEFTFEVQTAGVYYFGFNVNDEEAQGSILIDDIKIIDSTFGSDEFDLSGFTYYPNPVENVLNLSYTNEINSVEVYNLLGQKVLSKVINANSGQVDMALLQSGTYIVKVSSDNKERVIKVIKK